MRVERIGFTPLKGARHLAHDSVELSATGPTGDRVFCLVDHARENPDLQESIFTEIRCSC